MRIRFTVAVAPLYHPLRLAEDVAVLDLASGGRVELVLGAGYRRVEYEMLGLPFETRGKQLEEHIGILTQAWTGEPFELDGRTVRVTPRPVQRPRPPLLLGGSSPASARRAARLADGYLPVGPELWNLYRSTCEELGRDPGPPPIRSNSPGFLYVTDDPEAGWRDIAPFALHETNSYASWLHEEERAGRRLYDAVDDVAALRLTGMYRVVTPDECIALARDVDDLSFHALMGGLTPELSWASLELFAARVLPALQGDAPTTVPETTRSAD
jgi:alkanesulfonate monooxygenase SsuD/methylene tetrahydromethanopterin reductase-like flavin-dependent oxidoreductase (luciferase family)